MKITEINTQPWINNIESRLDEQINTQLAVDRFACEKDTQGSIQPNLDEFGSTEPDNMVRAEQDDLHKTHDGVLKEFESNGLANNLRMFTGETIVMTDNRQTYFDLCNQENRYASSSERCKSNHEIQPFETDKTVSQARTSEQGSYENNEVRNTNFIWTEETLDAENSRKKSIDNNGEFHRIKQQYNPSWSGYESW